MFRTIVVMTGRQLRALSDPGVPWICDSMIESAGCSSAEAPTVTAASGEGKVWSSGFAFDDALRPRKLDNLCITYPDAFYEVNDYDLQRALRIAEIEQRSWPRHKLYAREKTKMAGASSAAKLAPLCNYTRLYIVQACIKEWHHCPFRHSKGWPLAAVPQTHVAAAC